MKKEELRLGQKYWIILEGRGNCPFCENKTAAGFNIIGGFLKAINISAGADAGEVVSCLFGPHLNTQEIYPLVDLTRVFHTENKAWRAMLMLYEKKFAQKNVVELSGLPGVLKWTLLELRELDADIPAARRKRLQKVCARLCAAIQCLEGSERCDMGLMRP